MEIKRVYYGNKVQFGGYKRLGKGKKHQAMVLGQLECEIDNKLIQKSACLGKTVGTQKTLGGNVTPQNKPGDAPEFKLSSKLLYGGKGKNKIVVNVNHTNNPPRDLDVQPCLIGGWEGLKPPRLEETGGAIHRDNKTKMRKENNCRWWQLKLEQIKESQWTAHQGNTSNTLMPHPHTAVGYQNSMCPSGRALAHSAAGLLSEWARLGCPTQTGQLWTKEEIWEAVARGPHWSALSPEALAHFAAEAAEKVHIKQANIVAWDDIKEDPPRQLKISPIAAIPHNSKVYRSLLNLSFWLCLTNGGVQASVNNTMEKTAPKGAIDQIRECLSRIVHAFAETDPTAKIFMAKWDIKDGFWRMDCAEGEEWNFAYVLPQKEGESVLLVVPTSLQMGWVESPPYFCTATETARDVTTEYTDMPVGTLPHHKFDKYIIGNAKYNALPEMSIRNTSFTDKVKVYVDDFMSLVIPVSRDQLQHVAMAVMTVIHDVFPPDNDDSNDPILEKKLLKNKSQYSTWKTLLGFEYDGLAKTMRLEAAKRENLLTVLTA